MKSPLIISDHIPMLSTRDGSWFGELLIATRCTFDLVKSLTSMQKIKVWLANKTARRRIQIQYRLPGLRFSLKRFDTLATNSPKPRQGYATVESCGIWVHSQANFVIHLLPEPILDGPRRVQIIKGVCILIMCWSVMP